MKFRSLISALIVFTLVMTCFVSVVSAGTASYTTTTTYSTDGVTVTTDVTGLSENSMVSYVIYDDTSSNDPYWNSTNDHNAKYINQDTEVNGNVSFTITDEFADLNGKKILLGSDLDTLVPVTSNDNRVDDIEDSSDLLVTYDGNTDPTTNSVTFLVHQNKANVQTGINVVVTDSENNVYEFNNLVNLAVNGGVYDTYYAIQLVDERTNGIDFTNCTFKVTPVVGETEMTRVSGTSYWIEAAGN